MYIIEMGTTRCVFVVVGSEHGVDYLSGNGSNLLGDLRGRL